MSPKAKELFPHVCVCTSVSVFSVCACVLVHAHVCLLDIKLEVSILNHPSLTPATTPTLYQVTSYTLCMVSSCWLASYSMASWLVCVCMIISFVLARIHALTYLNAITFYSVVKTYMYFVITKAILPIMWNPGKIKVQKNFAIIYKILIWQKSWLFVCCFLSYTF